MTGPVPLSTHVGHLFCEHPLRDRGRAARFTGFDAVDHPDLVKIPARDMARMREDEGSRCSQRSSGMGDARSPAMTDVLHPGRPTSLGLAEAALTIIGFSTLISPENRLFPSNQFSTAPIS